MMDDVPLGQTSLHALWEQRRLLLELKTVLSTVIPLHFITNKENWNQPQTHYTISPIVSTLHDEQIKQPVSYNLFLMYYLW
jgi:hypothetical protein